MEEKIKMFIEGIMLCMLAAGIAVLYFDDICCICERVRNRYMIWSAGIRDRKTNIKYHGSGGSNSLTADPPYTDDSIVRLLSATLGINGSKANVVFVIISVLPSLIFIFGMADKLQADLLLIAALVIGLAPYIWLRLRLRAVRARTSGEGFILLTELLDNYKINYYNIREAVEATALTIKDAPNSRRLLFNLSKGMNMASDSSSIRRLLNDFNYSFGTSWARILTDNIFLSVSSGIRIDEALEDLIHTVGRAKDLDEYIKRENNEASLILRYLAPACYILTVIGAVRIFGLTLDEFIYYQFETSAGAAWLTASVIIYILTVFAKEFLVKNAFDI